jgi:hypothetical protein
MIQIIIIIFIVYVIRNYNPKFEYLKDENLFIIFYSAKNGERKRILIKNILF